jgi:biotin carboxylase
MPRILLLLPTTTYRTEAFLAAALRMAVREVLNFAGEHPIAAVVAVDDQVTVAAAAICEALSLRQNSVESVLAAGDKHRMRQLFQQAGVPSPGFQLCRLDDDVETLAGQSRYPCVVKPLGLSGSRGVIRVDDEREFVRAVGRLAKILRSESEKRKAENRGAIEGTGLSCDTARQGDQPTSSVNHFLLEDFIGGPEVALEGLLSRGQLRVLALFDKPNPLDGPFFEETIYVTPSRLPTVVQEQITRCTSDAVRALGLSEGPIHAELRLGADGPSVIEVNARSIGGQCSRMLRFGTGISLEELIIRHSLDGDLESPVREHQPAGVMMIPIPRAGQLSAVHGLPAAESVEGIERVTISSHVGQKLVPLPEESIYLGFIFARASSAEAVEAALREAHARLRFVIEPFKISNEPAKTSPVPADFQQ